MKQTSKTKMLQILNEFQFKNFTESNNKHNFDKIIIKGIKWQSCDDIKNPEMNPLIQIFDKMFSGFINLTLDRCGVNDTCIKMITESDDLKNLKRLTISGSDNYIYREGIEYLAHTKVLQLTHLRLINIDLDFDAIIPILSGNYSFKHLEHFTFINDNFSRPIIIDSDIYRRNKLKELCICKVNLIWNANNIKTLISTLSHNLLHLNLKRCSLEPEGAKLLSLSPQLVNLRFLNLRNCSIRSLGFEFICKSLYLKNLKYLNAKHNLIDMNGIIILLEESTLPKLKKFLIADILDVSDIKFLELLKTRTFEKISIDAICQMPYQSIAIEDFSHNPNLIVLESITLKSINLSILASKMFFNNRNTQNLMYFKCKQSSIDDYAIKFMCSGNYAPYLKFLSVKYSRITTKSLRYISQARTMRNLEYLNLSSNRIDSRGIRSIANSPYLKSLKHLILNNNNFESLIGWEKFVNTPLFAQLQSLKLNRTNIRTDHLKYMFSSISFNIEVLSVRRNPGLKSDSNLILFTKIRNNKSLREFFVSTSDFGYDDIDIIILLLVNTQVWYD